MNQLEEQLRAAKPRDPLPLDLHPAIMAAVRAAASPAQAHQPTAWGRGLWGLGLAAALALGAVWTWHRYSSPTAASQPLAPATVALAQGQQWTQQVPEVVLAPLTREMDALHRDLQGAWQFLLASLP